VEPTLEEALKKGIEAHKAGQVQEADRLSEPSTKSQDPPSEQLHSIINLFTRGQLQQALSDASQMLERFPNSAVLYNIAGASNAGLMQFDAAINSYKQSLKIKPDYAKAYNNMAIALNAKGDPEAAVECCKQALKIEPDNADAYNNMGIALNDKGDSEAAVASYEMALKIKPDYQDARVNKLKQQSRICDWTALEQDRDLITKLGISTESISPFSILPLEDCPERHRVRSEILTKKLYGYKTPLPPAVRPPQKPQRLRIGYFSADFREHPVAYLMAKVLEMHDRNRFEVYGYSIGPATDDDMRKRLIKAFNVFVDVHDMNDQDVALLARQDKIDIAIDLTGYTKNYRASIFAYRAAPVQINYLGYPGTMGADFIDYIIADQTLIPMDSQKFYSEKPIYLPHHYQAQDNTLSISDDTPSRLDLGLPDKGFVFCAINNSYKIRVTEFDVWMRLLGHVDGSVLWLLESNKWVKDNLLKEAHLRGISADRLVFAKKVSHEKYLAQFRQADLYLDTFNYNAGATASNALWAGLPVLTKLGESYTARMAGSLLASIGLSELITHSAAGYEKLALALATNPERLAKIRQTLVDNRLSTPLFDTALFTKHLENGYQQVYQRYYDSKLPEAIFVSEHD
jgi:protein O-GlcNAc transferase